MCRGGLVLILLHFVVDEEALEDVFLRVSSIFHY
jgi:hypothetical protein